MPGGSRWQRSNSIPNRFWPSRTGPMPSVRRRRGTWRSVWPRPAPIIKASRWRASPSALPSLDWPGWHSVCSWNTGGWPEGCRSGSAGPGWWSGWAEQLPPWCVGWCRYCGIGSTSSTPPAPSSESFRNFTMTWSMPCLCGPLVATRGPASLPGRLTDVPPSS